MSAAGPWPAYGCGQADFPDAHDGVDHGAVMSTEAEPVEHEDRWVLNLRGPGVAMAGIDSRLTLAPDAGWHVVLKASARLSTGSPHTGSTPTPASRDVAAALPLFGAKVLSAVAFKSGVLRMVFDNGTHLTCPAGTSSEAWQITGPRGWRFVSLPGGDLAVRAPSPPEERDVGRGGPGVQELPEPA